MQSIKNNLMKVVSYGSYDYAYNWLMDDNRPRPVMPAIHKLPNKIGCYIYYTYPELL